MINKQKVFNNFYFSESLRGISNILKNLTFIWSVGEMIGGRGDPPPPL